MILPEIHEFLGCRTPDGWVQAALADQETLLIDHKNCEFKAASTALSLIAKYHSHVDLINLMSRLAREELVHHEQVMRLMKKRKIELRQLSAGRYASGLRKVVRSHEPVKLVDTLVVGAFIEARSCERFEALVPHLDEDLGKFYFGLLKSEARHFQGYLKLAYQYGDAKDIAQVIDKVRAAEQELIESPDVEFRFHSGVPPRPRLSGSNPGAHATRRWILRDRRRTADPQDAPRLPPTAPWNRASSACAPAAPAAGCRWQRQTGESAPAIRGLNSHKPEPHREQKCRSAVLLWARLSPSSLSRA